MLLAAKPSEPMTVNIAELKAIEWSLILAEEFGWKDMEWRCDAQCVVNQLKDKSKLCQWETWESVSKSKEKLEAGNWKMNWTPRNANKCANLVAKIAIKDNIFFFCTNALSVIVL